MNTPKLSQTAQAAALLALLAALGTSSFARATRAGTPSLAQSWPVDRVNPDRGAPTPEQMAQQPLQAGYFLMDVAALGDEALRQKRFADAVKFFGVLSRLVPDRAISFTRSCEAYQALGNREKALQNCRDALGRGGATVADSARYVNLVLGTSADLTAAERGDVDSVLTHLGEQHADMVTLIGLECQFAAKVDDLERLAACSSKLQTLAPQDPRTAVFLWTLAARRGERERANELLAKAKAAGVAPELLAGMVAQTNALLPPAGWSVWARVWAMVGSCALFAVAIALLRLRWRRTVAKPLLGIVARM